NNTSAPAEIHTSVEEAKKAEETARQERIEDKQAELNAHNEANLFKKEIEHKDKK
ncbi:3787_t:CDS:1, partial [Funneliformis mosseae]